jgi:hypothetical protein
MKENIPQLLQVVQWLAFLLRASDIHCKYTISLQASHYEQQLDIQPSIDKQQIMIMYYN